MPPVDWPTHREKARRQRALRTWSRRSARRKRRLESKAKQARDLRPI